MADRTSDIVGPPVDPSLIPGFDDDRKPLVIFCVVFCLTVATTMVALRVYTRTVIIKKFGPDDWAAIATLIITWGEGISYAVSTKYGLGKHIWAIDPPTLIPIYWKSFWVTLLLYHAGLLAAKMTFLLAYYRILGIQRMRIVYFIAIIVVGLWGFAQVLIALLICRPLNGMWDKSIPSKCMPTEPQIYINAGGNIITDVAIFLLPMPAIKGLNLRRPQKILLLGVFSLGFFTVAISVVRIKFLAIKEDVTWDHVESSGWSVGELTSALTCACLPTLRPLLARFFPVLGSGYPTGSGGPSGSSNYPSTIGGGEGRRNPRGPAIFKVHDSAGSRTGGEETIHFSSDKTDLVELGLSPSGGRGHSSDEQPINGAAAATKRNPNGW
ncbi:hypothetical protein QBC39DRAFT_20226 [Podospora conica]|nr:hypothetical protein QBC39DRAFT_20226 [Schizothecium conicum]